MNFLFNLAATWLFYQRGCSNTIILASRTWHFLVGITPLSSILSSRSFLGYAFFSLGTFNVCFTARERMAAFALTYVWRKWRQKQGDVKVPLYAQTFFFACLWNRYWKYLPSNADLAYSLTLTVPSMCMYLCCARCNLFLNSCYEWSTGECPSR